MFRYVGFVWDAASGEACSAAQGLLVRCRLSTQDWSCVMARPGLSVHATAAAADACVLLLDNAAGVVLGPLFRRMPGQFDDVAPEHTQRVTSLGAAVRHRIVRSEGRELVDQYWGNYVAFLAEPSGHTKWVLHGPAAALPCLHVRLDSVDIYFSCTETVAGLLEGRVSFNWKFVVRSFSGPGCTTMTGLNEVHEVPGGTCHRYVAERCTSLEHWHPLEIADAEPLPQMAVAARALRDSVRFCTRAHASRFRRVAVSLSGGLDSSIVLATLQDAPGKPEVVCFTHFAKGADSDERVFARHAARRAGCVLIEIERHGRIDLRRMLTRVRFESNPGFHTPDIDRIDPQAALQVGAEAIFKGHGGDELFCRHHTSLYLVDFLRQHGINGTFWSLALHSAVVEGETFWAAVARAIWNALRPQRLNMAAIHWRDQEQQSLLNDEVVRSVLADDASDGVVAPSTAHVPPGRMWQANLALSRRPYYTPFSLPRDPETVSSLLTQPVIEVCLRIPTWLQMTGKRDRAVARTAFADDIPWQIATRSGKGGAEGLAREIVAGNLPFMREVLLDGELARRQIADRGRLEAALSYTPGSAPTGTAALLELLAVELWLLAWTRK